VKIIRTNQSEESDHGRALAVRVKQVGSDQIQWYGHTEVVAQALWTHSPCQRDTSDALGRITALAPCGIFGTNADVQNGRVSDRKQDRIDGHIEA